MSNLPLLRKCVAAASLAALGVAGVPALAAETWNLRSTCGVTSTTGSTAYSSVTCGNDTNATKVVMSAFGASSTSTTSSNYASASMRLYSGGWGIQSMADTTTSPDHSMDNNPLRAPDLFLLKFDTEVILQSVSLGWWSNDADITVMAYDQKNTAGNPVAPTVAGRTACSLMDNNTSCSTLSAAYTGWTYVKSFGDSDAVGGNTQAAASSTLPLEYNFNNSTTTANVASSYWLISAYNANYGGGVLTDSTTAGNYLIDNVKLLKFSTATPTTTTQVAEPGSLALASLALIGGWGIRRRRGQVQR